MVLQVFNEIVGAARHRHHVFCLHVHGKFQVGTQSTSLMFATVDRDNEDTIKPHSCARSWTLDSTTHVKKNKQSAPCVQDSTET